MTGMSPLVASQAVVMMTHRWDDRIRGHIARLKRQAGGVLPVFVAVHREADGRGAERAPGDIRVTLSDGCALLPGRAAERDRLGHPVEQGFTDLLVMPALLDETLLRFDHLWLVEYDVDFAGDWATFFRTAATSGADLIGTTIHPRRQDPDWVHWRWFRAPCAEGTHVRSFLPVARFSRSFLRLYLQATATGLWQGHFEALYPTIALAHGLIVEDLGGDGPFCPTAWRGLHYTNSIGDPSLSPGSFVYRPAKDAYFHEEPGSFSPGLLHHPVKVGRLRPADRPAAIVRPPPAPVASPAPRKRLPPCTIAVPTINSAGWIEEIAAYYGRAGLDPVFFVDTRSTDDTMAKLRSLGARVFEISADVPRVEALLPAIAGRIDDRWILRIDDDEVPSRQLIAWLATLDVGTLRDCVAFSRRWLRFTAWNRLGFAASDLWDRSGSSNAEDRQYRLFNKDRVFYNSAIHTPGFTVVDPVLAPAECCLFHFDWILRSKAERIAKMLNYDSQAEGAGSRFRHFYLPENVPAWDLQGHVSDAQVTKLAMRLRQARRARERQAPGTRGRDADTM